MSTPKTFNGGEFPAGAIANAHICMERLETLYDFACQGGPLANCDDWIELRRCVEHLAEQINAAWPAAKVEDGTSFNVDIPHDLLMHVVCDTRHPERQIQASRMIGQMQRDQSALRASRSQAAPVVVARQKGNRYCAAGACLETDDAHDTCCRRNTALHNDGVGDGA